MRFSRILLLAVVTAVAFAALAPAVAVADRIVLERDRLLRGEVLESDDEKVVIRLDDFGGMVELPRDRVLAIEPDMPLVDRIREGFRRLATGNPDTAYYAFLIALDDQDDHPDATRGFIEALHERGVKHADDTLRRDALRRARTAVVRFSTDARLRITYGRLLTATGDFDRAAAHLKHAKALEPTNGTIHDLAEAALAANRAAKTRAESSSDNGNQSDPDPAPGGGLRGPTAEEMTKAGASGNNIEAQRGANDLLAWARKPDLLHEKAFLRATLRLGPAVRPDSLRDERTIEIYQKTKVLNAGLDVFVDEEKWLRIEPTLSMYVEAGEKANVRERKVTIMGWYYQLKKRYPLATVDIRVFTEREGRANRVVVASARWDDAYQRVVFDKFEPE